MSSEPTTPDGALTRRRFMKIGAAGTVGAVGLGGAGDLAPSAVGESEAIAPVVLVGGAAIAAGAGVNIGWALRQYEVIGSDSPPEGLTPGALHEQARNTFRTRRSTYRSTFVDNQNIIENLDDALYGDGKVAAIEEINNQSTQANVESAGLAASNAYATTIQKNLLKSFNELSREFQATVSTIESHADLSLQDVLMHYVSQGDSDMTYDHNISDITYPTESVELADGTTFDVEAIKITGNATGSSNVHIFTLNPANSRVEHEDGSVDETGDYNKIRVMDESGSVDFQYLQSDGWVSVWDSLTQVINNVNDGLLTWVDGVYDSVQSGDLNPDELLTSRELAEMSADEEGYNQAVADLMALNVSVNLEREAEIYLPDTDATVKGSLAVTGDTTLSTGTIDPSADDMSYYLTYDISQGEGTWSNYVTGIDGGTVTFTSEPYAESEFDIHTTAGETATVATSDFSETDAGGEWTVDVSDQLETQITDIDSVSFYSNVSETQYETVQLKNPFEIVTFTDSEGNEHDSAEHTSSEPQTDSNYITEEEWAEREQRYEDLIADYEDSKSGGGGGFLDGDNGGIVGIAVMAALGGAALLGR